MNDKDKEFLAEAIRLGKEGVNANTGGPFGAVIVKNGVIVGKGCNSVSSNNDPTAHAEIVAIRDACKNLSDFQLTDCVIYSSCEPCPMCLGAIYWARPLRLVFSSTREEAAAIGFDDDHIYREVVLPVADRSIPTEKQFHPDAVKLFQLWKEKIDKTDY